MKEEGRSEPTQGPYGEGGMAARIRAHDWAATPLGPLERWPQSLRTAVDMVLAMPGPATILWGPPHVQIYNDAYVAIARHRHPALLGRPVAESWPDAYEAVIAPLLDSAYAGRATRLTDFSVSLEGPDRQVEERVFDTDWSPIRDESGAVAGALQTLAEATDRLKAETAMRESEARHRLLIGSWAQAVWETDANGVVIADSPSWRAYTGQALEEWLGYGWLNAIHPDDRAYAERQWREAVAAHGLVNAEFRLRAPDGGWRCTNVRAAPMLDAAGSIEKWVGMNIDIDARKRADAALHESEERYRALFESMDEAYAVVEVLKDEAGAWTDFRFVEVNPAFMAHTGMPWPIGQTATQLLGEPNPRWTQLYGQALDMGEPIRVEESEPTLDRVFDLNIFTLDRDRNRVAVLFTNITERKRAEAALRESEALRRVALDSGGMGAWTWNTRAGTVRADAVVQKLWGVSTDGDLMYPEGAAWLANVAAKPIASGEEFQNQVQVASGPTINRWVELRGRAERDTPWIINGVSFDITEQRLAEQRLSESETLFRTLAEVIEDVFYVTDLDAGRLDYLSPAYEGVWGRPAADLIADLTGFIDTIHPDDRPEVAAAQAAQARGEAVHSEYRIVRPDGEVRWILDRCFPIPDDGRRLSAGVASDITQRREAEARVRAGEERLRLALEVGRLGAWDWDLRTGEVSWSDEHYRMQGYKPGEVTPSYEAWALRIHPDDRPATEAALRAARDDGGDYAHEFRSLHPDGTVRWLSAHGHFFFDEQGTPNRMVGAMLDVTERREWEERQAVMVAELQHRTRNLIAVVRSIAGQTMAQTGPTEVFRDEFNDRLEALARVQGLLSRSDEEPITIEALIRMELDALGAKTEPGRIEIGGPPARIRHSVVQTLALALHELATNARKYGALSIDQGRLDVRWRTYPDVRGERLALEWTECGGQPPKPGGDARRGYGRELIEHALPYSLNAKTSFEHDEAGLRCTIDMPLERTKSRRRAA